MKSLGRGHGVKGVAVRWPLDLRKIKILLEDTEKRQKCRS